MSFEFISKLPTPAEIRHQFPLSEELTREKHRRDQEIQDILTGKSDKFLVIIGPCSADNEDSVCDYVSRLVKVQEDTKDKLLIVPRVYTNKPRTTGEGYKGILHQPNPEKAPDLFEGLLTIRKLQMRVLKETDSRLLTKCSTLKTTDICLTFSLTWPWAPALWKTSSTALLPAAWKSASA